ncbi:biotin--[acetyl-CoA-carboxylase] ligase [Blochmannia endosymbiont of Colobopsis nipponica]|uniref:biotin--[acetyl-CoA-carboxylase] ligase n=1 Tax=Blochmannia endosymbiont of Colobopsis nipponica TaxID=2681987 RepID=UPI00177FA800|nr:biotin--[acetyl-CoA-carboxylase] ligase [Blochmannia endosymbiont of Colobopsis nipponica]QOI11227.1 biotin--[acetyl-CoA-carboxylase] ligase [Blochmannia endosymbiont of Colobopsis nipponica]
MHIICDWELHDIANKFSYYYEYRSFTEFYVLSDILKDYSNNNLFLFLIIDSTNKYLIDHIVNLKSGDVCIAEYQSQGMGRLGRKWISFLGGNLYFSIYWHMVKRKVFNTIFSPMVAVVVAETLKILGVRMVRIKWPNDIYLNNRKLAGILVEIKNKINDDFLHLIIGIGINLSSFHMSAHYSNMVYKNSWASLQEFDIYINRNLLIFELISVLHDTLRKFEHGDFRSFVMRWSLFDNFYNKKIKLLVNNKILQGINRGINRQGALLLERSGRVYSYLNANIF